MVALMKLDHRPFVEFTIFVLPREGSVPVPVVRSSFTVNISSNREIFHFNNVLIVGFTAKKYTDIMPKRLSKIIMIA